jgi:YesN/AraC family two-component response regulator
MPEMTGEQLIARLREQQPNASYIVMSGHCDFAVAACRTPGVSVVISKPWDDETLRTILSACTRAKPSAPKRAQVHSGESK